MQIGFKCFKNSKLLGFSTTAHAAFISTFSLPLLCCHENRIAITIALMAHTHLLQNIHT